MGIVGTQGKIPPIKELIRHIENDLNGKAVAHNRVGNVVYVALHTTGATSGRVDAYVVVVEQGTASWYMKSHFEGWNPYYYKASKKVLDALSENPYIGAQTWRAKCRHRLACLSLGVGAELSFNPPLQTADGKAFDYFRVVETNGKKLYCEPFTGFAGVLYELGGEWWENATIVVEA